MTAGLVVGARRDLAVACIGGIGRIGGIGFDVLVARGLAIALERERAAWLAAAARLRGDARRLGLDLAHVEVHRGLTVRSRSTRRARGSSGRARACGPGSRAIR